MNKNAEIMAQIKDHEDKIRKLYAQLAVPEGLKTDKTTGWLEDDYVWRADLTAQAPDIIAAIQPAEPKDPNKDPIGKYIPWSEFIEDVEAKCLTDYDGGGDLVIDGVIAYNSFVYITIECVVIIDRYMIPFTLMPKIFQGHTIGVQWSNK